MNKSESRKVERSMLVTLGLADCTRSNVYFYFDQLLYSDAVLRACCLALVQARSTFSLKSKCYGWFMHILRPGGSQGVLLDRFKIALEHPGVLQGLPVPSRGALEPPRGRKRTHLAPKVHQTVTTWA